jgi:hypothetical protein
MLLAVISSGAAGTSTRLSTESVVFGATKRVVPEATRRPPCAAAVIPKRRRTGRRILYFIMIC